MTPEQQQLKEWWYRQFPSQTTQQQQQHNTILPITREMAAYKACPDYTPALGGLAASHTL